MRSHKKHKARGRNLPSCRIRTNQPGSKTPPRTTFLFSISFKYWQFVVCRLLFSLQNTLFPHNTTITFRDALDLHAENHSIMLGMTNMCQTKISAESNRYIQPSGQQAKMIKIPFQSAPNFGKEATHNTTQHSTTHTTSRSESELKLKLLYKSKQAEGSRCSAAAQYVVSRRCSQLTQPALLFSSCGAGTNEWTTTMTTTVCQSHSRINFLSFK